MTPSLLLLDETRAWLVRAAEALTAPATLRSALFHCQQAAEKSLKAFLTWHQRPFPKTHDLPHDAERFVTGSLRRSTDNWERCEWIDVIFEEGAAATAALRGFDPNEGYRQAGRLLQSVLRDQVSPAARERTGKQARVA